MAANAAYWIAAASTVTTVAVADDQQRVAKNTRKDMERDKAALETTAAQRASAQTSMQRAALRKNSLFTGAGDAGAGAGQATLGV